MKRALQRYGVQIAMGQTVDAVFVSDTQVKGVRVQTSKGPVVIEARHAVIFGSGGFAHNPELRRKYMAHRPIDGTAAFHANDGVMVHISEDLGLDLVFMDRIWAAQCLTQESQNTFETESSIFICRGDSSILVNSEGSSG